MSVSAGTVRSVLEVEQAVEGRGPIHRFPYLDPEVVGAASGTGVVSVPGAATPTEVWRAANCGADLVKLLPARDLGGPEFVKAIRGPLGDPALVPTGGLEASNAAAFLDAGGTALGVGWVVFPPVALEAGDVVEVERRCRLLIAAIQCA